MSRRTFAEKASDPEESYADAFAAALLMPRPYVEHLVSEGASVLMLVLRFDVPREVVVYRLKSLGLWPSRAPRLADPLLDLLPLHIRLRLRLPKIKITW